MCAAETDVGKREQNKAEKHRRLTTEANRLFREQGYDRTSIEQIAGAAGVARGTFYLYFPTRLALLEALLDTWFTPLLALLAEEHAALTHATNRDQSREIYEDIGGRVALLALEHRHGVALALQELRTPGESGSAVRAREARLVAAITELSALAHHRGLIDAPEPHVAARVVLGAIEHLTWSVLHSTEPADPLAVTAEAIRLLSRALGVE